jgi:CheY-like chemotaxis protein
MREQPPDLALMDLSMPEMDGYSLLAHMQQDPGLCHIPVAVITAHTGNAEEERRLGGKSLIITHQAGFTNDEVLTYLRHTLEAAFVPGPLRHASHPLQGDQQVGLKHRLLQVASSAQ